ncbi:cytochrome c oxidase subunit II [Litorilinea aerophila]|nr:cytochrome c oxidase subunit II [Litorilinea aerophila]MCC9077719.1 cytochrome c oxidase subunit II [Litorilinea aerophila]GIV76998.1 MAG: cytochrome c oxidase subunit II [Litorilinea sp.]
MSEQPMESQSQHEPTHGPAPEAGGTPAEALHVDRFEGAWIRISVVILAVFLLAVLASGFAMGVQVPGVYQRIDPRTLYDPGSPFANPGLRELAPGKYELYLRAQIWQFAPNEIHIPAGSEVTFYVTSQDVQHGFKIMETNVNMMVLPGQISTLKTRFDTPGTYEFVCHEYCGQLHHTMFGRIIVEAPTQESTAQAR